MRFHWPSFQPIHQSIKLSSNGTPALALSLHDIQVISHPFLKAKEILGVNLCIVT